jgi:phthiocerol/phenolphthiocerol synthesis type-I polyketide synthase E
VLDDVHDTLKAVPHYGIGYGLLRYLYAPTARALGSVRPADLFFSYAGTIPDLSSLSSADAPVQFDTDAESPVREAVPGLGHAVELRAYRSGGRLHLDWWYDARRLDPALATSLSDGLSSAVMELIQEAVQEADQEADTEEDMDSTNDELVLVELS